MVVFGFFLVGLGLALCLRAAVTMRHGGEHRADDVDPEEPARWTPPRRGETGRAVLRTMRAVNDVRAAARGPGTYGRRLLRRQIFRGIRRW